jgi:hypothetical protein
LSAWSQLVERVEDGTEERWILLGVGGNRPRSEKDLALEIRKGALTVWASVEAELASGALQIRPEELLGAPIVPNPNTGIAFAADQARFDQAVRACIDSYTAAHGALLSLSSSSGAALPASAAAGAIVDEAALPALYERWILSFERLLEERLKREEAIGENLLILRLTPNVGRYGEVPQRPQEHELRAEPKPTIWPTHPARRTEAYALEPIPDRFYFQHHPSVFLREDYRIDVHHRGFGIGANLYSLSLLPEEEQTIVAKSFQNTQYKVSESTAENFLEESGSETANDFANEVARENQSESSNQSDFSISAKASASLPFASGSVEAAHSSQDSVKDFSKNVSNTTKKLAEKLSSKRTVSIETKRDRTTDVELHKEINTERKIKNPNLGHTVTFHWFQMTRKLMEFLSLEDAKLVYSSGKHNPVRIFVKGELPEQLASYVDERLLQEMPPDVARRMPPNSAVVVVSEPYTEVVSMAAANGFLARVFQPGVASEINGLLWRALGFGPAAPDGLGVTAFPGPPAPRVNWPFFAALGKPDPSQPGDAQGPAHVAADKITVGLIGANAEVIYLPNLDLRYKLRDGQAPTRYVAPAYSPYALPRLLYAEERIVNTNGVFCDAMVGRCTALEDYLQRHRDLDLLEKKIQVGKQEIEFRWLLAKDSLVEIFEEEDKSLTAIVREKEGADAFKERLELEKQKLAEQKAVAADLLEKRRVEGELDLLRERVNELRRKIELLGATREVKIDAPDGSDVQVKAAVDLGGSEPRPPVAVKVE